MNAPDNNVGNNGAELDRVTAAARDALTDDTVVRLAGAAGDALELLDQINRSGLGRAIPALAQMVDNGDLERLVALVRVYGSAEDALTDETVARLAETIGEGISLIDRASRGGAGRIVEVMERMESSGALERLAVVLPKFLERLDAMEKMLQCFDAAAADVEKTPAPGGGIGGLWRLLSDPESVRSLQFLLSLGKHLRTCQR
jgi:uncharacterized protein YjgD (DUF1641 family)